MRPRSFTANPLHKLPACRANHRLFFANTTGHGAKEKPTEKRTLLLRIALRANCNPCSSAQQTAAKANKQEENVWKMWYERL
jgi:ribosomal protein L44E